MDSEPSQLEHKMSEGTILQPPELKMVKEPVPPPLPLDPEVERVLSHILPFYTEWIHADEKDRTKCLFNRNNIDQFWDSFGEDTRLEMANTYNLSDSQSVVLIDQLTRRLLGRIVEPWLKLCLECDDGPSADAFVLLYAKRYIKCVFNRVKTIYEWDDQTLLYRGCDRDSLRAKCRDVMTDYFTKYKQKVEYAYTHSPNDPLVNPNEAKSDWSTTDKKIDKPLKKYQSSSFLDNIIKLIYDPIRCDNFEKHLNNKPGYIPLGNGMLAIIDITGKAKFILRKRTPSDYYTKQLEGCYNPDDTTEKPVEFFNSMFIKEVKESVNGETKVSYVPDSDCVRYIQQVLGLSFLGVNILKKVFIFHGPEGDNGKSLMSNIMKAIFGYYHAPVLPSLINGISKDSNACTPGLTALENKRCGFLSEPKEGLPIDTELIKRISGDDDMATNPKGKEVKSIDPTVMMYILCNNVPDIRCDRALLNRLEFVELLIKFVDVPNPDNPYERLANRTLKTELLQKKYIDQFTKFFIDGALAVISSGQKLSIPESVNARNAQYKGDIFPWIDFIKARCVEGTTMPNPDGGKDITLRVEKPQLYREFKEWFDVCKQRYPGNKRFNNLPGKQEWFRVVANRYSGSRLKTGEVFLGLRFKTQAERLAYDASNPTTD